MSTKIMPCSQDYNILCGVLERNGILYEVKSDHSVACIVCAGGGDIRMTFSVDTTKMLVTLIAPVITGVPAETATDMALAVCMINDRIPEGAFCFDVTAGIVYFRLTQSYYNRGQTEFIFEYMLSSAAGMIEKYRPGLRRLSDKKAFFTERKYYA